MPPRLLPTPPPPEAAKAHRCTLVPHIRAQSALDVFPDLPPGFPVLGVFPFSMSKYRLLKSKNKAAYSYDPSKNNKSLMLDAAQLARACGLDLAVESFAVTQFTDKSVHTAFANRTDRGVFKIKHPHLLDRAVDLLTFALSDFEQKYLHPDNLPITKDGAAGATFSSCVNKENAYKMHRPHILAYVADPITRPPLFYYEHKKEVLPLDKVQTDATRPIVYCPVDFYYKQRYLNNDLDEHMKTRGHPYIYHGFRPFSPDLPDLVSRLKEKNILFKGDVSKFDGSFKSDMFRLVQKIRVALAGKHAARLHSLYDTYVYGFPVALPSGAVVHWDSQPSGQPSTTSDNCIAHCIIVYYMVLCRLDQLSIPLTTTNIHAHLNFALYADDHVASTDDPTLASFLFRRAVYAEFGMTLKEADDYVGQDMSKMTFLGCHLGKTRDGNTIFDFSGDIEPFFFNHAGLDLEQLRQSADSYSMLLCNSPRWEAWARFYSLYFGQRPHAVSYLRYKVAGFEGSYLTHGSPVPGAGTDF